MTDAGEAWDVRMHWKPSSGVTCPEYTTHTVKGGETQAIDSAVSALDGCRHPWSLIQATGAEIRRAGDAGAWRSVGSSGRSYL